MLAKRIIPCFDVANGRVVKGVKFVDLRDAGDPVEQAAIYDAEGADELVFLDILASHESRGTTVEMARRVADAVFIPFTIGGGVRGPEDFRTLLLSGADKCGINSAAVRNPELLNEAAWKFGAQCVVHRPGRAPHDVVQLTAELLLLVEKHLQAFFQIAAHEALHGIAIEADHLRQQLRGEHGLATVFMLGDDLQQDRSGQILAGLGVADLEFLPVNDQLAHFFQRYVAGDFGVVETPVRVLLDDAGLRHSATLTDRAALHQFKRRHALTCRVAVSASAVAQRGARRVPIDVRSSSRIWI